MRVKGSDMATLTIDELVESAERLSTEQLETLVERLKVALRAKREFHGKRLRLEDLAGTAPYPLCGEDAQAWVSRTRAESDEMRTLR